MLLPLWLLSLSLCLNWGALPAHPGVAFLHAGLLFCFIYSIFLFCSARPYLRLPFAFLLALELFVALAYNTSININMLMSLLNADAIQIREFAGFHAGYLALALLTFLVLSFALAVPVKPWQYWLLALGLLYLLLPAVPRLGPFVSGEGYPQQWRAARARGLPQSVASVEILVEDIASRFAPLHWFKSGIDLYLILHAKTRLASSWTQVHASPESPDLLVLGIGESLRADNMSLYGYSRNTTPKLLARLASGELALVPKAYSAGPTTWTSLPAILAFNSVNGDFSKSVINLAKAAGYKTYWFSNQGRYGATDRSVAAIAEQADVKFFYKSQATESGLDAVLIDRLQQLLAQPAAGQKRLVVLHFYGSHMEFKQRYPGDFAHFSGGQALLNEYDNSVLYTDTILDRVLQITRAQGGHFLFFADHGLRNPEGINPLTHDNTDNPELGSLKVPLLFSLPSNLQPRQQVSLFNFGCLFASWAAISAQELHGEFCQQPEPPASIKYYDVRLSLRELPL